MKVTISGEGYLKIYEQNKNLCLGYWGKGTFSLGFLGSEVDRLKKLNKQMEENCKTTTLIDATTYWGEKHKIEVKTITLSEEYKKNKELVLALQLLIDILVFKNSSVIRDYTLGFIIEPPVITLKDFEFTDEEVLLFASEKNYIYPKYENKNKEENNIGLENKKIQEPKNVNIQQRIEYKTDYSLGVCPFCDGQGLLYVAKDINSKPYIVCDEACCVFDTMEDVKNKKMSKRIGYRCATLEEAIQFGYGEYIQVWRNNRWEKLIK